MDVKEYLAGLGHILQLKAVAASMLTGSIWLIGLLAVVATLEWLNGGDMKRYRTSSFLNDLLYGVFYRGGIYVLFIYVPLMGLLAPRFSLHLAPTLPLPLTALIYLVCQEFVVYWVHRLQHGSAIFWRFHRVHHAQTCLTFVTQSRFHVVDQLVNHLFAYFPIMLVLGVPAGQWFPLVAMTEAILALGHADLRWRFGSLGRIFVSPAFHATHHSAQPEQFNRNFGQILSVWDYVFGTALEAARPHAFGLANWKTPQSFLHELFAPFRRDGAADVPGSHSELLPVLGATKVK